MDSDEFTLDEVAYSCLKILRKNVSVSNKVRINIVILTGVGVDVIGVGEGWLLKSEGVPVEYGSWGDRIGGGSGVC